MTNFKGSTSCGECDGGGAFNGTMPGQMRSRQLAGGGLIGSCTCLAASFMGGGGTPCVIIGDGDVLGGGPDGMSRSRNRCNLNGSGGGALGGGGGMPCLPN